MITLHHLNNSRSQRIIWLLEELGTPYELVRYQRDATTNLAPPELKAVNPLGKSPVITDGDITIAESGAIVEYLVDRYGGGRFQPPAGSKAHLVYLEWLHYAEGSAMLPLMLSFYLMRLGEAAGPLTPRVNGEIDNNFTYIANALGDRDYLMGADFTGADVQVSFVLEMARALGRLNAFPSLSAYVDRLHARPAYQRAIEKGGVYTIGQ
jgi:glutathione S-transferase